MSDDQIRTELQAIRGDIASLRVEVMNILRNGCVHGPEHAETLTISAHSARGEERNK